MLQERLCRCGRWATSKLSYAKEMEGQQNTSPASSSDNTPPSSPPTDQSYLTLVMEQVTVLVPVLEDVQLPLPNSSEEEPIRVPLSGTWYFSNFCFNFILSLFTCFTLPTFFH